MSDILQEYIFVSAAPIHATNEWKLSENAGCPSTFSCVMPVSSVICFFTIPYSGQT